MTDHGPHGPHGPQAHPIKDSGLQPERTAMGWTRTSLAVLLSGAVLLFREVRGVGGVMRLSVVGLGVVIAVVAYRIGQRRQETLRAWPLPETVTARRQVYAIGIAVIVMCVLTSAAVLL